MKSSVSQKFSNFLIISLTIFTLFILYRIIVSSKSNQQNTNISSYVTQVGEIQYINIQAKGGYFPNTIYAKADIQSILRVETNKTFDCSIALSIPEINYRNNLPSSGITEIQLPPKPKNSELKGTCSMGMYGFKIKFI